MGRACGRLATAELDHLHRNEGALRERTHTAANLSDQQSKKRAGLAAQRKTEADKLTAIRTEKAKAEGDAKVAKSDLDQIKYLAQLLHTDVDTAMSRFILFVALILDPLALILMFAAWHRR